VRESGFILANIYQGGKCLNNKLRQNYFNSRSEISVQVQFVGEAPPRLRGGPLPSDYLLSHVNFYWGNEMGSLHSIDNHL
jgi:Eukaryotic-type carbonic anhydrase